MSETKDYPKVFLDITVDGEPAGRIVIELFTDKAPRAAENFRCLCTGEKGIGKQSGKPLHLKGTSFCDIVPDCTIYGGIYSTDKELPDSIYGGTFEEKEDLSRSQNGLGLVCMSTVYRRDTYASSFHIIMDKDIYKWGPWVNNDRLVIGQVVQGMEVASSIGQFGDESGKPSKHVVIADCGQISRRSGKNSIFFSNVFLVSGVLLFLVWICFASFQFGVRSCAANN